MAVMNRLNGKTAVITGGASDLYPLLGQSVALGEDACHFRHVLGSPGAQRDDRVSQAATERGQRVVHARRHLLVVGPRQHVIGLQILQLLDRQAVLTVAYAWRAFRVFCLCVRRGAGWYPLGSAEDCQGARPAVSRIRKTSTHAAARS